MTTPPANLEHAIAAAADPVAFAWFTAKREAVKQNASALPITFGQIPRRLGRADLGLAAHPGLTLDQAARILLLLDGGAPAARLEAIVARADLGELVAIYRGLSLYPDPASLVPLAIDGLRTAMRAVFEAVAHHNPFPAKYFAEPAWNHMILKALFIDSTLYPIVGLDRRWNADLARMLINYAHERRAAHRAISPELWRGVGRFADLAAIADLAHMLASDGEMNSRAAALALSENPHSEAATALAQSPALAAGVRAGHITWDDVR